MKAILGNTVIYVPKHEEDEILPGMHCAAIVRHINPDTGRVNLAVLHQNSGVVDIFDAFYNECGAPGSWHQVEMPPCPSCLWPIGEIGVEDSENEEADDSSEDEGETVIEIDVPPETLGVLKTIAELLKGIMELGREARGEHTSKP